MSIGDECYYSVQKTCTALPDPRQISNVCVCVSVEAVEGRKGHNNGWNGVNGMASNHVFDTIPPIPLQPLPLARPPQLRCHQPPVAHFHICCATLFIIDPDCLATFLPLPTCTGGKSTQLSYLSISIDTLIESYSSESQPVKYYLSESIWF